MHSSKLQCLQEQVASMVSTREEILKALTRFEIARWNCPASIQNAALLLSFFAILCGGEDLRSRERLIFIEKDFFCKVVDAGLLNYRLWFLHFA